MSLLGKMRRFVRNEFYDTAIRQFDQGRYEEAISTFTQARASGHEDALNQRLCTFYMGEAYANLGHVALKARAWERAKECFEHALEAHPHYADLHYCLASALRAMGRSEAALDAVNASLVVNPRFAKAYLLRGLLLYGQEAPEQALGSVQKAVAFDPGFDTEAYEHGLAFHANQDFASAVQAFEQVSHTEVDDILFHYKLGDDLFKRGLYTDAIAEYQKALSLNPNYADIRNHLGIAFSAQGMTQEAVAEFRHALVINPRYMDAMLNLALTLRDMGELEEARALFAAAAPHTEPIADPAIHAAEPQPKAA